MKSLNKIADLLAKCEQLDAQEKIQKWEKSRNVKGEIHIDAEPDTHNNIVLRITDNGCGIPHNKLKNIFSHGYSTKQRNTGFGLHSNATFVQTIGGSHRSKSGEKNRGAMFTVTIPMETIR